MKEIKRKAETSKIAKSKQKLTQKKSCLQEKLLIISKFLVKLKKKKGREREKRLQ